MKDWEKFFEDNNSYRFKMIFYGMENYISLEELYQAFKARLEDENEVDESI